MAELEVRLTERDIARIALQVAERIASKLDGSNLSSRSDNWLTTAQAAKLLSISVQRLEIWRTAGGGPKYYKPSRGIVRYRASDIDEFMAGSKRRHTGEEPYPLRPA